MSAISRTLECASSAVECRTRNQVNPGSNPPFATVSKFSCSFVLSAMPQSTHLYNEYLATDSRVGKNPQSHSTGDGMPLSCGDACRLAERESPTIPK